MVVKELIPPFNNVEILKKKKSLKKLLLSQPQLQEKKIALLSGTTIGEIKTILELFLLLHEIRPIFYEGDYNCFYEDIMFDNPELEAFCPDIIYFHTSNRNIDRFPDATDTAEQNDALVSKVYQKFENIWHTAQQKYSCAIIQNNFEMLPYRVMGNADCYRPNGGLAFLEELNRRMYAYANNTPGFFINDIHYLSARCGLERWFNPSQWYLYKYSQALEVIPELCFNLASIIKSIYGKNKKALALDLDNTMWGGVIGDDGVENLALGHEDGVGLSYLDFQKYIKKLKELGIMLNVCSKNSPELAQEGFTHPSSQFHLDDFICFYANWEPKHSNLQKIAGQLNILPESVVFVDDNPAERDIVQQFMPDVAVPRLSKSENYIIELDRQNYFEVTELSTDDLNRSTYYRQNIQREQEQEHFSDYSEYLRSLDMACYIEHFSETNFKRVTQLINKTNQFNFTGKRYTEEEIYGLIGRPDYIGICGRLTDKFGDNGIVTAMIGAQRGQDIYIDLWVMSCRTFKRDLEFVMFDQFVDLCKKAGVRSVTGKYIPTKKNGILKDFYTRLGFQSDSAEENVSVYKLDISAYSAKQYPMEVLYK